MQVAYCLMRQGQSLSARFIKEMDHLGYGAPGKCDPKLIPVLTL